MLKKFLLCYICTSRIHPFSLGNYLVTSLFIGNLMRIRVTSVEWAWLELRWHATLEIFKLLFQEVLRKVVFVWNYKLLFHIIYIAQACCVYILSSYYLCFHIPSRIRQLYAICHISEKMTPR